MLVTRLLGAGCFGLVLYWLRFFLWRHDPATLAQLLVLTGAGCLLLLQERPVRPRSVWFRGAWPVAWPGWLAAGAVVLAVVLVFGGLGMDAHSASDALHRTVPTYSLLAAITVKLLVERSTGAVGA